MRASRASVLPLHATALAGLDPRAAAVVELRYFGEVAWAELAEALDMSETSARQNWAFAKAWLFKHLASGAGRRAD